jgi:uncharacterized protein (TIGR02569 family)
MQIIQKITCIRSLLIHDCSTYSASMASSESLQNSTYLRPQPPESVLRAFGISSGTTSPLSGGQGESWLINQVVLKPTSSTDVTNFYCLNLARLLEEQRRLLETDPSASWAALFRVPAPIAVPNSTPTSYVYEGWTATHFVQGEEDRQIRIEQILSASRAMHRLLKTIVTAPDPCLSRRDDRWAKADRIAWDEVSIEDTQGVNGRSLARMKPWLHRLWMLKRELRYDEVRNQLVHLDLSGNVLYSPSNLEPALAPAIIDFTGYWRPVEYTEAIMVADGITWKGNGLDLVKEVGLTDFRIQMLLRALLFRVLAGTIEREPAWSDRHLPEAVLEGPVSLVEDLVEQLL